MDSVAQNTETALPTTLDELRRAAVELEGTHARILYPRYASPTFVSEGERGKIPVYLSVANHVRSFEIRLVHGQTVISHFRHEKPFNYGEVEVLDEFHAEGDRMEIVRVYISLPSIEDSGGQLPCNLAIHVCTFLPDGHHPVTRCPKSVVILPDEEPVSFAVMSDFHFLDAKVRWHDRRTTAIALSRKAVRMASEGGAHFILGAGDIASYVFLYGRSFPVAQKFFRTECSLPTALVPGNHDGYILGTNGKAWLDGLRLWRQMFGPTYYSFKVGPFRFIGLNSYDWDSPKRNLLNISGALRGRFNQAGKVGAEQLRWFESELRLSKERGEAVYLFLHHNPLHRKFVRVIGKLQNGGWDGSEREEVVRLIREGGIRGVFSGHEHFEQYEEYAGIPFYTGASIGGVHDRGEFWGFRMIRAHTDGTAKIVSHRLI